jgi:hypothetical protein|tara:strand:- start:425 stop:547 length:123 start_codon:yes stop_codon:yes gene_type:complete
LAPVLDGSGFVSGENPETSANQQGYRHCDPAKHIPDAASQ